MHFGSVSSLKNKDLDGKQTLDTGVFSRMHDQAATSMTFGLLRFFAHQVTLVGLRTLYFPRAGHFEALLGAGVGFYFWHNAKIKCVLKKSRKGTPTRQTNKKSLKLFFGKYSRNRCGNPESEYIPNG